MHYANYAKQKSRECFSQLTNYVGDFVPSSEKPGDQNFKIEYTLDMNAIISKRYDSWKVQVLDCMLTFVHELYAFTHVDGTYSK